MRFSLDFREVGISLIWVSAKREVTDLLSVLEFQKDLSSR